MEQPAAGAPSLSGRERALAAARDLFASQGYAEVSMQTIAAAAGLNKATLYHHFGDKEELFVAVLGAEFEELRATISETVAVERPFREQLVQVARVLLEFVSSDKSRLMMQMHQHVSTLKRHKLHNKSAPPWTEVRDLFVQEMASGVIRSMEPDFGVTVFWGMAIFQGQRARYLGTSMTNDELAAEVVDLFLLGARPRPSATPASPCRCPAG